MIYGGIDMQYVEMTTDEAIEMLKKSKVKNTMFRICELKKRRYFMQEIKWSVCL